ncbi:hypothetical protein ACOSQ3_020784 [Xanthoceras sorbifolium]
MEKVGFKYAGTSSINTGKSKGSRFDILKDLTDFDSEEGNFQKGKGVDFKVKGVLSKVTNLKVTTSGSKKPRKAKGSFKLGDSGCSQKKTDGSSSKGKKQLMRNTNSGNEKSLFYSGWPADSSIEVRADNSQWAVCIGIAALSWPIGFLLKCLPVSGKQHFLKHGASAS